MPLAPHVLLDLEDHGQDFLWFRVDTGTGEIIGCGPFQADLWTGRHVAPETGKWAPGARVAFVSDSRVLNYPVRSVTVIDMDFELAQLDVLLGQDGPYAVNSKSIADDMKRLDRQGLVHWSEASRSRVSKIRGYASLTALGLEFIKTINERNAA
ncbi:MAG: hypothetical protein LDL39_06015 [Magnetospirillum sp.]|nr:hypothetical protein [Magnetospirillum sp.]